MRLHRIGFIALLVAFQAHGQWSLHPIFQHHMVLQRRQPIPVWGRGIPGREVTVLLGSRYQKCIVQPDSSWHCILPAQQALAVPQTLEVHTGSTDTLRISDILFGDVWVCIGQSNMQFSMKEEMYYTEALAQSLQPLLRLYNPAYSGKNVFNAAFSDSMVRRLNDRDFYQGSWQRSDSLSFRDMSAVAWYFGQQILENTGIPQGMIHLAIGGSPLEAFISREALAAHPRFASKLQGNWLVNPHLPDWIKERGSQNVGKLAADSTGPNHGFKPGFAFSAGIQPLLSLPVKGVLLYQGESNAQEKERVQEYGALQQLLANDLRSRWQQPDMPFYWVQLSSIDSSRYKSALWPEFRNVQRLLLDSIPHGGMAVCSDIGAMHNVHPANKKYVGERLARWALFRDYGKKIIPSGPLPAGATYRNGKVIIRFNYTGSRLGTSDGKMLRGFSFNGIQEVPARIKKQRVFIPSDTPPGQILYGWKPYTDANLVNGAGLPASTFRIPVKY